MLKLRKGRRNRMSEEKNCRYRFTVPTADTTVNEWLEEQSNISFSLRVLIKAFIRDYGMQDATCLEVGTSVKRRGRPPKQAQIHLESMSLDQELSFGGQDVTQDDYEENTEEVGVSENIAVIKKQPVEVPKEEQSIDDMLNIRASKPTAPPKPKQEVKKPAQITATDDEGFVDPESLFG